MRLIIFCIMIMPCIVRGTADEVRAALATCSYRDAQLTLNLWHYSYQRSRSTCVMQAAFLAYLSQAWNAWYQCAQRRFNPSRLQDTVDIIPELPRQSSDFHLIATRYAYITQDAYHASQIVSPRIRALIEQTRAESRSLTLSVLWEEFSQASAPLLAQLAEQLDACDALQDTIPTAPPYDKNLVSSALGYLAAASFDHVDATFLEQSNLLFEKFIAVQDAYNQLWRMIETTRAYFYRARYLEWYRIMQELEFPEEVFIDLFTQQQLSADLQPLAIAHAI
jgi:hypothetical protein